MWHCQITKGNRKPLLSLNFVSSCALNSGDYLCPSTPHTISTSNFPTWIPMSNTTIVSPGWFSEFFRLIILVQHQPDLTSIVIALSIDAANTMASLYDLQTALINAQGRYSSELSADFSKIKTPLMDDWKDILAFLQRCSTFGGDIATLNESLQTERSADCAQFLVETIQLAKTLHEESHSLLSNSEERSKTLAIYAPNFGQQLKNPFFTRPLEASSIDLDQIYSFVAAKIRCMSHWYPFIIRMVADIYCSLYPERFWLYIYSSISRAEDDYSQQWNT